MPCSSCYNVELPECASVITLRAGLQADQDYIVIIADKFNNKYGVEVTSDVTGVVVFDANIVPAGTFNRYAGDFKLEVKLQGDNCNPETLRFCCNDTLTDYSCVIMSFIESDQDAIIGCICNDPLTPGDPSTPTFKRIAVVSGTTDGVNDTFLLAHAPTAVYYNGNLLTADNYVITGVSVTYNFVPFSGESVDFWGTY